MEEVGNEDLAVTNPGRYAGMGIMISGTVRSRHAGFEIGRLSRRSDNGLPGLDSRRCFVYELLLTREKFYEEADYVWRRTGTGPQSSGHGCVRDTTLTQQPTSSSRSLAGRKRQATKALQEAVESRKMSDKETASLASQLDVPLPPEVSAPKKVSQRDQLKRT